MLRHPSNTLETKQIGGSRKRPPFYAILGWSRDVVAGLLKNTAAKRPLRLGLMDQGVRQNDEKAPGVVMYLWRGAGVYNSVFPIDEIKVSKTSKTKTRAVVKDSLGGARFAGRGLFAPQRGAPEGAPRCGVGLLPTLAGRPQPDLAPKAPNRRRPNCESLL